MPKRIQLSRKKGWRKPAGAVVVSRPSKWGNPWAVGDKDIEDREDAERAFAIWAEDCLDYRCIDKGIFAHLSELRGRDLACWCPLDGPCHADVLLKLANPT